MRVPTIISLFLVTLLTTPLAIALPGESSDDGLRNACAKSGNANPCRWTSIIYDTSVGSGEVKVYKGEYLAVGTIVVNNGGTVIFDQAHVTFNASSGGVVAEPGSTLTITRSVFNEEIQGSDFGIDAQPTSHLTLVNSTLREGTGIRVATEIAQIKNNLFSTIEVAMRLEHVSITLENNHFLNNTVGLNETGGFPIVRNNRFDGGEYCIRDWYTDPTIINNIFDGCHVGILHERSESEIGGNTFLDREVPPGVGILVKDTMSPTIHNNTISRFGTGIVIVNARAYIRDNIIHNNVGDGIRIDHNSAPMDIQRNTVTDNGGHGIHLINVSSVPVFSNVIERNGGDGIRVSAGTTASPIRDNVVRASGGAGIVSANPNAILERNQVSGNGLQGIVVTGGGTRVSGGSSTDNGASGIVLSKVTGIIVEDVSVLRNGADGVRVDEAQASLRRVNASNNVADGFRYSPKGALNILGDTDLLNVRAFANGGSGLHNVLGNATFSRNAWWQGNADAGVRNDDVGSLLDVRESYWGSPTGPTHVANPTGTGDKAIGNVVYTPFRTTPPA